MIEPGDVSLDIGVSDDGRALRVRLLGNDDQGAYELASAEIDLRALGSLIREAERSSIPEGKPGRPKGRSDDA